MAGMITDLSALSSGSVDRTADLLEIVDLSANTSYKITVNNLVGISGGAVVSTTDSQSLTNKTLDNTNALTIKDGSLTIQNTSSTTKQAVFSATSITAGQTRTFTFPDVSGTIVLLAATQTLTNKTLTSPTITGGTIDNSTVTVDSISGHTSASIVTVAGLQISSGVVGTNGVATASISDGAVTPAKLTSGTGSGWSWSSWTPTWTSLAVGASTVAAKYIQVGKTVFYRVSVILAGGNAPSGDVSFTLPITSVTYPGSSTTQPIGQATYYNTGVQVYDGSVVWNSTTIANLRVPDASGTYLSDHVLSSTIPFTWGNTHQIFAQGFYEAA